jgi:membrane fusion protein, heavy metal efflux system
MKSLFFSLTLISVFGVACNHQEAAAPLDAGVIPDSVLKNLSIVPVTSEAITDVIRLNGKVQANESKQAKIYALASGRVGDVKVELGDYVKQGTLLAEIRSAEVAGITGDLSAAEANLNLAKKSLETTQDLYASKLATERDLAGAQADYNKAKADLNKQQQLLQISGGNNSNYYFRAPISGYVITKNIFSHSEVRQDNNNEIFTIADLSNVWIMANVYEADINHVHLGDTVTVATLTDPQKTYIGRIDKIYNVLDPVNRTMQVRISMNNPNNELKPEMFATVEVKTRSARPVESIPAQAIIFDNSKNYVVVKKGKGLVIKPVEIIKRVDTKAYVSGLNEGDEVVASSQVFIYQALISR